MNGYCYELKSRVVSSKAKGFGSNLKARVVRLDLKSRDEGTEAMRKPVLQDRSDVRTSVVVSSKAETI